MILSDVSKLESNSREEIHVRCDKCDREKHVVYKNYNKLGYKNGYYLCRTCKMEKTNMEKYGVKNVFQLNSIKKKSKETIKRKYGVDNVSKNEDIKRKKEETNIKKFGHKYHMMSEDYVVNMKEKMVEKYGVDNISKLDYIKQQKVDTCKKNHGVEYIFFKEEFKENLKKHNLLKYGVEHSLQSDIVKEKIIKTNLEKYGVEHSFQADIVKEKIIKTNLEKYGVEYACQSEDIKYKLSKSVRKTYREKMLSENKNLINIDSDNKIFTMFCDKCDSNFDIGYMLFYKRRETGVEICTNCYGIQDNASNKEIKFREFLENNYDGTILPGHRLSNRKELDIYLPDINLAFEFNGIYYHSDLFRDDNYHLEKTLLCEELGIELVHIWEDDWDYKTDIILSLILNKLNKPKYSIKIEKCIIKNVKIEEAKNFLNNNHIEGFVKSSIKLGLYYNEDLVCLVTFLKRGDKYILNRFCNKIYYEISGGFNKLFEHFLYNYSSSEVISFSNKLYSNGNTLISLGFTKTKTIKPDYNYVLKNSRKDKSFIEESEKSLPKIYDTGKDKFRYIKK